MYWYDREMGPGRSIGRRISGRREEPGMRSAAAGTGSGWDGKTGADSRSERARDFASSRAVPREAPTCDVRHRLIQTAPRCPPPNAPASPDRRAGSRCSGSPAARCMLRVQRRSGSTLSVTPRNNGPTRAAGGRSQARSLALLTDSMGALSGNEGGLATRRVFGGVCLCLVGRRGRGGGGARGQ